MLKITATPHENYWLKTFRILEITGVEKLIWKVEERQAQWNLPTRCIWRHIRWDTHISYCCLPRWNEQNCERYTKEVRQHSPTVFEFLQSVFEGCLQKRAKNGNKQVVVKPIISTGFKKRGQVDLINYQTVELCSYQCIMLMLYQDQTNKFTLLAPMFNKTGNKLAKALISNDFTFIGVPDIL